MSNRPPATYWRRYVDTSGSAANGSTAWPQDNSAPGTLALTAAGANLHVLGIFFEGAGDFVATPSEVPAGETPAAITQPVPANAFLGQVPASIDPATTAFPLVVYYGPLGLGAR